MIARLLRRLRAWLSSAVICLAATAAWAQAYVVTPASGRIEPRPASAVRVDVDSVDPAKASAPVTLPFAFSYYGRPSAAVVVSAFGWLLPGAKSGFDGAADPSAAHGQNAASGAFPYGAGADGVMAPLWAPMRFVADGSDGAGAVYAWTTGTAPARRFVVSWENVAVLDGPRITVQAQLFEGPGRIVFAYAANTTGAATSAVKCVCGLDSPIDSRFVAPVAGGVTAGLPGSDFVFEPRTVLFNSPDAVKRGTDVTWQDIKRESLSAENSAKACCYVAKGDGWFFVPDRATRSSDARQGQRVNGARAKSLADEDRVLCGGAKGDPARWVRQVLDGKAVLLPNDGGAPVRFWFRIVEYFTVDEWGLAGPDQHVWNLRHMVRRVFPDGDPRGKIENYCAWRAMAGGRLSVVKLFDFDQKDDAGRQYTTGRDEEYVLEFARSHVGPRGPMPDADCPAAGWTRFALRDENLDRVAEQHADRGDLRVVLDPNYVDGHYSYVARSDGDVPGWITRRKPPIAGITDETIDDDPGGGAGTGR